MAALGLRSALPFARHLHACSSVRNVQRLAVGSLLALAVLASAASGAERVAPAWNGPIVFVSNRSPFLAPQLVAVDAESGSQRQLTRGPRWHRTGRWSPDGTRIALVEDESVAVMDADGTDFHVLVPEWGKTLPGRPTAPESPTRRRRTRSESSTRTAARRSVSDVALSPPGALTGRGSRPQARCTTAVSSSTTWPPASGGCSPRTPPSSRIRPGHPPATRSPMPPSRRTATTSIWSPPRAGSRAA